PTGGQAGADVQELPDPGWAGQEAHHADQEGALGPGGLREVRELPADLLARRLVGGEEGPAPEPVVPHPGRMLHAHGEPRGGLAARLSGVIAGATSVRGDGFGRPRTRALP